jgi:hypothetical protein
VALTPKEPQYGDQTQLRRMGVKTSPDNSGPVFFNPEGGRPSTRTKIAGIDPQKMLGGAAASGPPPAPVVPAEHQELFSSAADLAAAARGWSRLAARPDAPPKVQRIALALKEAARLAILEAREGTPYYRRG